MSLGLLIFFGSIFLVFGFASMQAPKLVNHELGHAINNGR